MRKISYNSGFTAHPLATGNPDAIGLLNIHRIVNHHFPPQVGTFFHKF